MNIYWIGGSPCAGKSTVAEILSQRYGLYYFKVDDFLDEYTNRGATKGYPICKKQKEMSWEQIWMREPELQCEEEFAFYAEIFAFVLEDIKQIHNVKGIITEGAAYVPKLMKLSGISKDRYLSITPTAEFQIFHYRKREFVPYILESCEDKESAFRNWMNRDILFAEEVRRQCREEEYFSITNSEEIDIARLVSIVTAHFGLE